MEIRGARESEVEQLIDLAADVFVQSCKPRYASQHYEDSTYALHQSRVCVFDGRVVSQVRVSEREMRIGSAVVKLGGVGLVGTLEQYRRNGYSSAVLRDAVEYMASEGYDMGLLFTSIQPFYARLGWAPFPQTTFELELGPRKQFESTPWTVREFQAKDLPKVIEIYGEHNRARTGTIVRKPRQWSDAYGRQTGMPPTLVAERKGVIGAYANVGLGERGGLSNVDDQFLSPYYPNVREVGCATGSEDALVALCRNVLQRAHDAALETITGRLPRHDPMTLLLSRESGMPLSFSVHERSMYRIISLSSLLTKIAPELQRRLQRAGLTSGSGSYLLDVGGQTCALTVDRGSVHVEGTGSGARLVLDSYRFLKMLLGDSTFSELAEYNRVLGLNLDTGDAALLDVLFPKTGHTHWICDYF